MIVVNIAPAAHDTFGLMNIAIVRTTNTAATPANGMTNVAKRN